jgi:hypothetical protein
LEDFAVFHVVIALAGRILAVLAGLRRILPHIRGRVKVTGEISVGDVSDDHAD